MLKDEHGNPITMVGAGHVGLPLSAFHPSDIYSIVKTVEQHELESHTMQGWRLIAVLQEQRVELAQRQEVNPHPNNGNNYQYNSIINLNAPQVVTRSVYLLGLDEHSSMSKVNNELHRCQAERSHVASKLIDLNEKYKETERKLANLTKTHQQVCGDNDAMVRGRAEQAAAIRKYEGDIAKIRAAIGELKMKEIIGG